MILHFTIISALGAVYTHHIRSVSCDFRLVLDITRGERVYPMETANAPNQGLVLTTRPLTSSCRR